MCSTCGSTGWEERASFNLPSTFDVRVCIVIWNMFSSVEKYVIMWIVNHFLQTGLTPLLVAIQQNQETMVKFLILQNADVFAVDNLNR